MSKGITPVVATVLLITVTIAAAGTLYTVVEANIQQGKKAADTDLPLNINSLKVEQCYETGVRTNLVLRNGAGKAINASKLNLLLNGSLIERSEYRVSPQIVNPERAFTVNMSQDFGDDTSIIVTNGENKLEYSCFNLD